MVFRAWCVRRARLRLSLHGIRLWARLNSFGTLFDLSTKKSNHTRAYLDFEQIRPLSQSKDLNLCQASQVENHMLWWMVLIYSKFVYLFIVQNRFLVIHECNEKTLPAMIYIARDTVPTQWTAAPRYANSMLKSLPNALSCVNTEGWFYVCSKRSKFFPEDQDSWYRYNIASESEALLCDNCPRIWDFAYETSHQLHRLGVNIYKR